MGERLPVVVTKMVPKSDGPLHVVEIVPILEVEVAHEVWPKKENLPSTMREWEMYAKQLDAMCYHLMQRGKDVKFCVLSPLVYLDWARNRKLDSSLDSSLERYIDESLLPWHGPGSCMDEANAWQLEVIAAVFAERERDHINRAQVTTDAGRIASELLREILRVAHKPGWLILSVDTTGFINGSLSLGIDIDVDTNNDILRLGTRYTMLILMSFCKAAIFCRSVALWRSRVGEDEHLCSWSVSLAGVRGNSAEETRGIVEGSKGLRMRREDCICQRTKMD